MDAPPQRGHLCAPLRGRSVSVDQSGVWALWTLGQHRGVDKVDVQISLKAEKGLDKNGVVG